MPRWLFCVLLGATTWTLLGCGGSGSSGGTTGGNVIAGPGPNVVSVAAGGSTQNPAGIVNGSFTSVSICSPGTSTCATISGLLVDTGSTGLRVLSSVLPGGFTLPQQTDSGGNPIVECLQFGDGFTWGPVKTADMKVSGEQASSLPIQIVGDPNFTVVPASCSSAALGPNENTVALLGANGILGVGNFLQDCGAACTVSAGNPGLYFSCPASGCVVTTESLSAQVSHPVAKFATDNNGVIVELPAVAPGGAISTNGALVFGIGTQSNNMLGSATILTLDANGNFATMFKNSSFPGSFVDTGSNGLFFLTTAITGLPMCPTNTSFYCPTSVQNLTATNIGTNGHSTPITFSVANADSQLTASNPNFLLPELSAPFPTSFDWGLPFFFGRNVFVAIEGQSTPGGTGPYTAY
ncbi:MAG TPA: DUF3443 domain-containing protein [Candidatus Angelobacter sp.]